MTFARSRGLLLAVLFVLGNVRLLAQNSDGGAAGVAGCAACSGFLIMVPLAIIALDIAILVWVAKDSKARGMDSPVLWMLLVFFTSFIGLIVYLLVRPPGNTVPCPNCQNKRLESMVKCPHCGFGS
jgi:hypothetical protein